MEVEVVSDSAPDRPYRGRIGFISPVAEFTPKTVETPELRADLVYRLRVIIGEADAGLRQGLPVTVRLPPGPGADGDGPGARGRRLEGDRASPGVRGHHGLRDAPSRARQSGKAARRRTEGKE